MKLSSGLLITLAEGWEVQIITVKNKPVQWGFFLRTFHLYIFAKLRFMMSRKRKRLDNMKWRGIWWDSFHGLNKVFPPGSTLSQAPPRTFVEKCINIFCCNPSFVIYCTFTQSIWLDKLQESCGGKLSDYSDFLGWIFQRNEGSF